MRCLPAFLLCLPVACADPDPDDSNDPTTPQATTQPTEDDGPPPVDDDSPPTDDDSDPSGTSNPTDATDATDPTDPTDTTDTSGDPTTGGPTNCDYPPGAVEPMTLGEVLSPYTWPTAIAFDGTDVPLDLADAPCGADGDILWSPHDVLVFISVPAW